MATPTPDKAIRPDAVAIYVRWSTEEQGEGTTLQEQLERCRSYVLSQGWRVNAQLIFIDDGYSGATLQRPALTALRQEIALGRVDCVVSLKIDRLSRSLVDCVELVLREWNGVCHYKSVSQPVNTTDELSRVFFAILAGFAEYERALIRERTFSGLVRRVQEGNFWGSRKPPYGYRRVGTGTLAVDEQEASVVRLIFDLAANQALGPVAIAARLNGLSIPAPEGKGWWAYTARALLRNRLYIGYLVYGKRFVDQRAKTARGNRVLRRREEPLVSPARRLPELALVSDELFARAQRLLDESAQEVKARGPRAKSAHLLTGIARCRCGGSMITGYDAQGRRYYFCAGRDRSRGGKGCEASGGFVYADQVEPVVAGEVTKRLAEALPRRLEAVWAEQQESASAGVLAARLADLAAREARLAGDLARIRRQARRGEITLAEKRDFEQDIAAERQELEAQRKAVEAALTEMNRGRGRLETLLEWAGTADQWAALTEQARREVVGHLIDHLVLNKPKGRNQIPEVDFYWKV